MRIIRTCSSAAFFLVLSLAAGAVQTPAPEVSRAEFAAAYLRFETALQKAKLAPADEIRVNKAFDALTLQFFTRNLEKAMGSLNELTDSIDPKAPPGPIVDLVGRKRSAERLQPEAAAIRDRLDSLPPSGPGLAQARAAVRARAGLLAESFNPEKTAQALMESAKLLAQIRAEAAALEAEKNPFAGRKGDTWRVFKSGDKDFPFRIFVPAEADTAKPLPLIIALHGAGGDENMFMDGYGAGLIKKLAAERRAIVVTPRTDALLGAHSAETFDALLETIGLDYALDPKRLFVLGHSMGGMGTAALLVARGGKIAAAACLCGFSGFPEGVQGIPPTLIITGELDPISNPRRIEPLYEKARAAGYPVEYRRVPNHGHTLTVAKILPDVISWLWSKGRS